MENEEALIKQAIKKLKNQVYYDKSNTNLHLRNQLVTYLYQHGKKRLEKSVLGLLEGKKSLKPYLKNISYVVIPKRIKKSEPNGQFITNFKAEKKTTIKDINLIIDAPLEIHLLSILWLIRIGYKIDKDLPESCYGNRLLLNEEGSGIVSGRGLLEPYYRQYQKWRDKGIEEVKKELERGHNATFVNLDISSYYYNVRLKWQDLEEFVGDNELDKLLQEMMFRVHQVYTKNVLINVPQKSNSSRYAENEVILPIGLFSSYILANNYLKSFDDDVANLVSTSYYGRYVDDIILVVSETESVEIDDERLKLLIRTYGHDKRFEEQPQKLSSNSKNIIKNFSNLFRVEQYKSDGKDPEQVYFFRNPKYPLLSLQRRKVMVYEFKAGYSQSVIDKLQKDIEDRSSEFRRLPTEDRLDFDKEVYELLYDDSFGKPRTLKDYKENRVGLSTYLYKATTLAIWKDGKRLKEEFKKVQAFFKGSNLIEYYQLWEKLFTLLVVADRKMDLAILLKNIQNEIEHLKIDERFDNVRDSLQKTLRNYLCTSLAQSFALKAKILNDKWFAERLESIFGTESPKIDTINNTTLAIRNIWFVRSAYVTYPLLEFTNWAQSESISTIRSLIEQELDWSNLNKETFTLAKQPNPYPRFFNLYEVSHYWWIYNIVLNNTVNQLKTDRFTHEFISKALEKFIEWNNIPTDELDIKEAIRRLSDEVNINQIENHEHIQEIHIQDVLPDDFEVDENEKLNIRIGLANMKVKWEHEAEYSLRGRPLTNLERLDRIYRILEKFRTEKPRTDLAIFPEISIPHAFTSGLLWFAKNHQFGMVFGIEHINTGKDVFNFIATVLPFRLRKRQDAIFIPRLKNHYSHGELAVIRANHLDVVHNDEYFYHLFKWRNLYFTTFYCFELADIEHRSWFRSKVDLLVASEYNQDVNYFSSIIDSTARDLNMYVAQVNSSHFGDNRLTLPAKTIFKNLIRLDGGENDLVIIATIDLKEFREHLEVGYEIQKDAKVYKPSPPNFDPEKVKQRIRGDWILKKK
ncbi:reverse transcriptase domain-containing protein [Gracilimonas mengyeensis]|uniref:Reverse transcriptase (RNA-dependent DNA polymerase) n=1 Tax=Gracilimonas mengyeensis TaxID=1302730 RepID=A0A521D087_9BACT|nr:reverse transcriptase domain-containing protein [Gracilimonas mengyeensis]SMO65103.1 Reverse transcriptase (RNA-dependent DNA polymerase) [Gracilimonas mengyeensis]